MHINQSDKSDEDLYDEFFKGEDESETIEDQVEAQTTENESVDKTESENTDNEGVEKSDKGEPEQQEQDSKEQDKSGGKPQPLRDKETGEVVQTGIERRLYHNNHKLKNQLSEVSTELETLRATNKAYVDAFQAQATLGLSPEEAHEGVKLVADFKQDPIKTLEGILTSLKSAGIDISSLNLGDVNTNATVDAVKKQFQPILDEHEQQRLQKETYQKAKVEVDNFVDEFPDAEQHLDFIGNTLANNSNLKSLPDTWMRIKLFAYDKGLDLSKPLGPQLDGTAPAQAPERQVEKKPLMGGNGGGGTMTQDNITEIKPQSASSNASYAEIIRGVMKDNNIN